MALLLFGRGVSLGKRIVTIAVVAIGLGIWAPQGYWRQMQSILSPKQDYNYTSKDGRKEVAKRGIGYMLARPVFGLGIGNFEKAECSISEKALNTPAGHGIRCLPPHNSFVQAGAELGVPGLILWASIPLLRHRLPAAAGPPASRIAGDVARGKNVFFALRVLTSPWRWSDSRPPASSSTSPGSSRTTCLVPSWQRSWPSVTRRVKEQRMEMHAAALAGSSLRQEAAAI